MEEFAHSPLQERRAGVLLHPTSLPGPWALGDFGIEAYHFIDFLAAAGQRVWQVLPLCPTHSDGSPYQGLSCFAGNPQLIDPYALLEKGWLSEARINEALYTQQSKVGLIDEAYEQFMQLGSPDDKEAFRAFVERESYWLDDYALFFTLKRQHDMAGWTDWPEPVRDRQPEALNEARAAHALAIERIRFEQYLFYGQWIGLKQYANERGILTFGDMPIFVSHDSADVWANRDCFLLDEAGHATVVAGVPPDYFSETGQRWGNPHYDWEWMEGNDFLWWRQRMASQMSLFDLVRIDHFRGFEAYWEIPAFEETAINGRWVKAPGDALFNILHETFDPLHLVAEDLGTITEEVLELRDKYALPGMKILQFAFGGGADNPYLPHNVVENSVVYTGTHDNDTTLGWYQEVEEHVRDHVWEYLGQQQEPMPWPLVRAAYASVARLAVVPMQDLLALGLGHRMNTPGTTEGNWAWRFQWSWVADDLAERIHRLTSLFGR